MQHVRNLNHDHQKQQQVDIIREIRNRQYQQRGGITEAVNRNHHTPLDFCHALQEVAGVAGEHHAGRDKQERIDGDKDRQQVIPLNTDQHILHRQDDKEAPEQGTVVGAVCRRQRDKLTQCQQGHKGKQYHRADGPDADSHRGDNTHQPPGTDTGIQVTDNRGVSLNMLQDQADNRCHRQEPEQPAEDPE